MILYFTTGEDKVEVRGVMHDPESETIGQFYEELLPGDRLFKVSYEELAAHTSGTIEIEDDGYVIHAYKGSDGNDSE